MRIDEKAGIIHDVLVLGRRAKNKRHYTAEAMRDAIRNRKYERIPVYIGPHKKSRFAKRSPNDHAGELRNTRLTQDGIRADLHYNRVSRGGKLLLEAAKRFPESFGLSHHADVAGYEEDGQKLITRIVEATVVDLVKDPATTQNVFESVESSRVRRELALIERAFSRGVADVMRALREAAADAEAVEAVAEAVEWNRRRKLSLSEVVSAYSEGRELTREQVLAAYS